MSLVENRDRDLDLAGHENYHGLNHMSMIS